jgi:FkbM family methyltransferase
MNLDPRFKRVLRTGQTWFPLLRSGKFEFYNFLTRNFGRHVEPEFRLIADLKPIRLALDVGGNWGQSIEAIRYYAKPDRIVCFEPNPPLARRLERIYASQPGITVQPFGLGAQAGILPLHTPIYGNFIFDGITSFDENEAKDFLNADRMAWFDPGKLRLDSKEVPLKRLDEFDYRPDMIKLDVQGFEYNVLLGGRKMFTEARPFTILENPSAEVVTFFADLDMQSYVLRANQLLRGRTSGHNTVFMTDQTADKLAASGRWTIIG